MLTCDITLPLNVNYERFQFSAYTHIDGHIVWHGTVCSECAIDNILQNSWSTGFDVLVHSTLRSTRNHWISENYKYCLLLLATCDRISPATWFMDVKTGEMPTHLNDLCNYFEFQRQFVARMNLCHNRITNYVWLDRSWFFLVFFVIFFVISFRRQCWKKRCVN